MFEIFEKMLGNECVKNISLYFTTSGIQPGSAYESYHGDIIPP